MAPKHRRGGGIWQNERRLAATRGTPEEGQGSELAYYLTLQVLWGAISPQFAKRIAGLALRDLERERQVGSMRTHRDLEKLASLSDSHTYQSLLQKLEPPMLPLAMFKLHMKLGNLVAQFEQYAMWPHECFLLSTIRTRRNGLT